MPSLRMGQKSLLDAPRLQAVQHSIALDCESSFLEKNYKELKIFVAAVLADKLSSRARLQ